MKHFNVVMLIAALCVLGCEKARVLPSETTEEKPPANAAIETAPLNENVSVATIAVHTASKIVNVSAELAVTKEQRARGLMGREAIPHNYGMWFVFPDDGRDPFWMKDTSVSLDIIFVDSDMKIVDIIAGTTPQSTDLLVPKASYRYVLEVASGYAAANGIEIGDRVEQRIGPAQ